MFVEQTENDIQLLNGYINSKDSIKIKESAHHIKGACLNLELSSMAESARLMETLSKGESWDDISRLLEDFVNSFKDLKVSIGLL
jgi:HPt (histidine-containing phosphotransfer) domain-containing protein